MGVEETEVTRERMEMHNKGQLFSEEEDDLDISDLQERILRQIKDEEVSQEIKQDEPENKMN